MNSVSLDLIEHLFDFKATDFEGTRVALIGAKMTALMLLPDDVASAYTTKLDDLINRATNIIDNAIGELNNQTLATSNCLKELQIERNNVSNITMERDNLNSEKTELLSKLSDCEKERESFRNNMTLLQLKMGEIESELLVLRSAGGEDVISEEQRLEANELLREIETSITDLDTLILQVNGTSDVGFKTTLNSLRSNLTKTAPADFDAYKASLIDLRARVADKISENKELLEKKNNELSDEDKVQLAGYKSKANKAYNDIKTYAETHKVPSAIDYVNNRTGDYNNLLIMIDGVGTKKQLSDNQASIEQSVKDLGDILASVTGDFEKMPNPTSTTPDPTPAPAIITPSMTIKPDFTKQYASLATKLKALAVSINSAGPIKKGNKDLPLANTFSDVIKNMKHISFSSLKEDELVFAQGVDIVETVTYGTNAKDGNFTGTRFKEIWNEPLYFSILNRASNVDVSASTADTLLGIFNLCFKYLEKYNSTSQAIIILKGKADVSGINVPDRVKNALASWKKMRMENDSHFNAYINSNGDESFINSDSYKIVKYITTIREGIIRAVVLYCAACIIVAAENTRVGFFNTQIFQTLNRFRVLFSKTFVVFSELKEHKGVVIPKAQWENLKKQKIFLVWDVLNTHDINSGISLSTFAEAEAKTK